MGIRTRLVLLCVGVLSLVGGSTAAAHAMAPPPQCIRNCSPVEIDTTGCYGVIVGNNHTLDNFCYLGPPPPQ